MSRHHPLAHGVGGRGALGATRGAEPAAKVLVVGPGEAGKSTLIARLTRGAVNLSVGGRTVAMDHGVLRRRGAKVSLVGVPGQPRFAAVREALAVGAVGAVWVHPAGEEADAETIALIGSFRDGPLPYLVYVNHRAGETPPPLFVAPPRLGPPRDVVVGNLVESDLGELVESLWTLAGAAPPGFQEEKRE